MDINGGDKNGVFLHDLIKITEGTVSEGTIFMHILEMASNQVSNQKQNFESFDNEEVEDTSVSGSLEEWKKCAIVVLDELKSHKFADRVFSVLESDATDDNVNSIIIRTMDISTIRKNIDNGSLKSNTDLHYALHHMFLNLVMSTAADSEVSRF